MKKWFKSLLCAAVSLSLIGTSAAYGAGTNEPAKPEVAAEGAVLMEASTGKVIFEKNSGTRFYPASITKLLTALLVLENARMEDMVLFRSSAVDNLEAGAVALNMVAGDQMSVKDCLYAMLLKSANEVANALAEHVSGSVEAFARLMTERAKALGCLNTNFVNPNGLNSAQHYTTAYDMALIASEAFRNETLCQIASTLTYQIPATIKSAAPRTVTMGHKMLFPNDSRYYEGIVGGKTGYTSLAGNTLVTCVERDGIRLVAVVLKSKQTHYADTKAMLDYGFQNAKALGLGGQAQAQGPGIPAPGTNGQPQQPGGQTPGTNGQPQQPGGQTPGTNGQPQQPGGQIPGTNGQNTAAGGLQSAAWTLTPMGWCYQNGDGSFARSQWVNTDNVWYYLNETARMASDGWHQIGGTWYYFGDNGAMYADTVTPDGYRVDTGGAWIQ